MNNVLKKACLLLLALLMVLGCGLAANAAASDDAIDFSQFTIDTSNADYIVVTLDDSMDTVLAAEDTAGRTIQMVIPCSFDKAYAKYVPEDKVVPSSLAEGEITFAVPRAGVYHILKGDSPVPSFTVTFNANGHGTAPAAQQNILSGGKATEPTAPTADGYTFGGWYTDAACSAGKKWDFNVNTVTENITLYAKWTQDSGTSDPTTDPTTEPTTETTQPEYGVTGISIRPNSIRLSRGSSKQFTATVTGLGTYDNTVLWSVSGNSSTATVIDSSGKLTVASGETARTLTVTATAKGDPTISATATVTVQKPTSSANTGDSFQLQLWLILMLAALAAAAMMLLLAKKHRKCA